jgi:hypothetical protein
MHILNSFINNINVGMIKGKNVSTKQEADEINALIKLKVVASQSEQKRLRDIIRKIGFYASDFGIGSGYTVHDFFRVVTIVDAASMNVATSTTKPVSIYKQQTTGKEATNF